MILKRKHIYETGMVGLTIEIIDATKNAKKIMTRNIYKFYMAIYSNMLFHGLFSILRESKTIPIGMVLEKKRANKHTKIKDVEHANKTAKRYIDMYGDSIYQAIYSYVHNKEDSEEILNDTIIKVLLANPHFENERHEKAYLFKTASNLAKNRIEYNIRHAVYNVDELKMELISEERENLSFVWEAVKKLPVNEREAVHLFYIEKCKISEIAKLLGRKEGTVSSDLHRGKKHLKEILKEEYDFD